MAEGTNLDLILSTDYLSIDDEKILQEENEANKITLGEGISLAIQQEQILPSLLKSYSRPELEPNYDFRLDDETFDELSKDIDPQYWEEFSNATSLGQAYQIKQRILDSQEANKKLSTLGFTGTALRLGAAILDPTALVADAVTFGFAFPRFTVFDFEVRGFLPFAISLTCRTILSSTASEPCNFDQSILLNCLVIAASLFVNKLNADPPSNVSIAPFFFY